MHSICTWAPPTTAVFSKSLFFLQRDDKDEINAAAAAAAAAVAEPKFIPEHGNALARKVGGALASERGGSWRGRAGKDPKRAEALVSSCSRWVRRRGRVQRSAVVREESNIEATNCTSSRYRY